MADDWIWNVRKKVTSSQKQKTGSDKKPKSKKADQKSNKQFLYETRKKVERHQKQKEQKEKQEAKQKVETFKKGLESETPSQRKKILKPPKKPSSKTLSKSDFQQELHESKSDIQEYKDFLYGRGVVGTFNPNDPDPFKTSAMRRREVEKAERGIQDISRLEDRVFDWHPGTKVKEVKTKKGGSKYVFDFPYSGSEKYYSTSKEIKKRGFVGLLATSFTPSDPLGLKSAYYTATGEKQKAWDVKVEAVHSTRKPFHEFYLSSPMGIIGTSYAAGMGIGAGVGTLSAVSATAGKAASVGIGGFFTYSAGKQLAPVVSKAVSSGDYGGLVGSGTRMGLGVAAGLPGYKAGYRFGMGRTKGFLYGRATYKPGSAEYIRYKNTLKTARRLQYVKSKDVSPLDFTKDIMRLDSKTAGGVLKYLQKNPKTVIGGSASQYAQTGRGLWYKYRNIKPRDVDLLVKNVSEGKFSIRARPHQVDIHGFEMGGKAGKYYRFGFETQKPIKIGKYRHMRLGEQVFRKGISSVTKETQYRWFKDIPDFKMASEQLISSGKKSYNPFSRIRAWSGSKSFQYVLKPSKASGFGKRPSYPSRLVSGFAKRVYTPPKAVMPSAGGYSYPGSYMSGSYLTGAGIGSYIPSSYTPSKIGGYKKISTYKPSKKPTYKLPGYKPSKTPSYKTPKIPGLETPSYKPSKTPSYKTPSYETPKPFGYKLPGYKPPKIPSYKTTGYETPGYKPGRMFEVGSKVEDFFKEDKGKKKKIEDSLKLDTPEFLFRKHNIPSFSKLLKKVGL